MYVRRNIRRTPHIRLLPSLDLRPRALVDRVVNRHHGTHIRGLRVVALALHGLEEHALRGIHPVPRRGVCAGLLLCVGGARGLGVEGFRGPGYRGDFSGCV